MDSEAKGQVGGLECDRSVRERMAADSTAWKCPACGTSNADIIKEREELCGEAGEARKEDAVPDELRLAYRDELGEKKDAQGAAGSSNVPATASTSSAAKSSSTPQASASSSSQSAAPAPIPQPTRTIPAAAQRAPVVQQQSPERSLAWIDTCIYGIVAALLFMVLRKFA